MTFSFSRRTEFDLAESEFARRVREARSSGREIFDLTVSNPTACGFEYEAEKLLAPLSDHRALLYDADPKGMLSARRAIGDLYYAGHGLQVSPEQIVITTSTSEGYGYLFRLLCDPGDEVLVPQPGYPLFDFLASFETIQLREYPLFYDHGWHIDLTSLEERITERTRAILLVHPNNPTGHFTSESDRLALCSIAERHGIALIVDEVFLDYPVEAAAMDARSFATTTAVLTFVLSGMSKIAGLPQMKAAWIVVSGPGDLAGDALRRLELIADTYLSPNAPVQLALPSWLANRGDIQIQIRERVRRNLHALDEQLKQSSVVTRLEVQAGWCAVLRVPAIEDDRALAIRFVNDVGVIVHPGSFYGFPPRGWLVVSLLALETIFAEGIPLLLEQIENVS